MCEYYLDFNYDFIGYLIFEEQREKAGIKHKTQGDYPSMKNKEILSLIKHLSSYLSTECWHMRIKKDVH